jgi:hypothetical protein
VDQPTNESEFDKELNKFFQPKTTLKKEDLEEEDDEEEEEPLLDFGNRPN